MNVVIHKELQLYGAVRDPGKLNVSDRLHLRDLQTQYGLQVDGKFGQQSLDLLSELSDHLGSLADRYLQAQKTIVALSGWNDTCLWIAAVTGVVGFALGFLAGY